MIVKFIHTTSKEYNNMIKLVVYKNAYPIFSVSKTGKRERRDDYVPNERSIVRTKDTIRDIALMNDFTLFATFTFDKRKHDRYNYDHCKYVIETWFATQRHKRGMSELRYLVVPELHKDGAIHFHALIGGYTGPLKPSGHKVNGRSVYNFTSYRAGFSTAVFIDNREAVAHYVSKYITKDFVKQFGRKRYFCSRYLKRPVKAVNKYRLCQVPPVFRKKVYENDTCAIYNIDPAVFACSDNRRCKNIMYSDAELEFLRDHPIGLDNDKAA